MTNFLKKGDTQNALRLIFPARRVTYKVMFTALGPKLPAITSTQVDFEVLEIREDTAKCELTTNENGKTYSYEVIFLRDQNGNWWIYDF